MDASRYFDQLAARHAPFAFRGKEKSSVAALFQRLAVQEGARILEPGCGHGCLTPLLAEAVGPGGLVWALDSSAAMTEQCRAATAAFPQVKVETADTTGSAAPDGEWDCVLCFRFYPHLADPAAFLARARRWLAPGGNLVIANLQDSATLNRIHAACHPAVAMHHMPPVDALADTLRADGWRVEDAGESPALYFLRAATAG